MTVDKEPESGLHLDLRAGNWIGWQHRGEQPQCAKILGIFSKAELPNAVVYLATVWEHSGWVRQASLSICWEHAEEDNLRRLSESEVAEMETRLMLEFL